MCLWAFGILWQSEGVMRFQCPLQVRVGAWLLGPARAGMVRQSFLIREPGLSQKNVCSGQHRPVRTDP